MKTPLLLLLLAVILASVARAQSTDFSHQQKSATGLVIGDAFLDAQIDRNRKSNFTIQVVDAQGKPLVGEVSYELIRHDFEFGTAISARAIAETQSEEDRAGFSANDLARYDEIVQTYFTAVVVENAMKWGGMENEAGPREDRVETARKLAEWAHERDLFMRGHAVFWGVRRWIPAWQEELAEKEPEIIEARMKQRLRNVLALFDQRISEWDLNNEMMHQDIFGQGMGWENGAEYFKWAKALAPHVDFYVNDYGVLQGNEVDRYVRHIQELLDAGAPVGGIGDQAHFWRPLWPNERLWSILNKLGQFGLPVKITEFDIVDFPGHGETQAQMLRRFYRVCFAHPAVDGIYLWGFWEARHWRPRAALWKRDWTPKPAAKAYMKLITEEFSTRGTGQTDAEGKLAFRGFRGVYRIAVAGEAFERNLDGERVKALLLVTETAPSGSESLEIE